MKGLIGKKVGMTSVVNETGNLVGVTVIELGPNFVTQVKTVETDGYNALQLGFGVRKEKNTSKPLMGHFAKAGVKGQAKVAEIRNFELVKALGDQITIDEVFAHGEKVKVIGISKGRGFQGVVKRHGFAGVGESTHGQHNRARHPGSIGQCSYPAKVFKGMKMGGRMGGDRVTIGNLQIVKIFPDKNVMLIKGSVPGFNGSLVIVKK